MSRNISLKETALHTYTSSLEIVKSVVAVRALIIIVVVIIIGEGALGAEEGEGRTHCRVLILERELALSRISDHRGHRRIGPGNLGVLEWSPGLCDRRNRR